MTTANSYTGFAFGSQLLVQFQRSSLFCQVFRNSLSVTVLLALVLALPIGSHAQRLDGTLQVEVTDSSGALVPGAKVTATNETTNVSANAISSGDIYVFPNLLPGPYKIAVEKDGFKKFEREHVTVSPNQVVDAKAELQLSSQATTIEVVAQGESAISVTSSQIQSGFSGQIAERLPITQIGGDVKELAVMLPNTTTQPGGINGSGGSIGGLRPRYNSFMIDGADDNSIIVNGDLTPVIEDSVADFTVLTNQFSAEYGHSAAGIFAITTKSGTNNFHGEGHEYNRNRGYNGLDNLQAARGSKDPYDYNRAGASIGGPILKDKLFFFGAFEYQNEHRLFSGPTLNAPTASGLATLMTMAHDPAVLAVLQQFATASSASSTTTVNNQAIPVGFFQGVAPNFTHEHDFLISMDATVGKHSVRGRYLYDRQRAPELNTVQPLAQFTGSNNSDARKVILNDVWAISPTLVNDFMFAFSRSVGPQLVVPGQFANFPNVEVDDLGINIGPNGCSPQTTIINTYQLADSVTKVFGSHTVKFGSEIRDYISPGNFLPRARGEWDYATLQTFINDQIPDGANGDLRGAGSGFFAANFKSYYGFVQDDWKATRKLTINAGLRYEYNGVPRDEALQNLNAIANDPGLNLIFRTPKADKNNWAPRLGFAYDPTGSGKWSVRGGMGLFYDIYPVNFPQLNLPPQLQTQQVDTLTCSLPGAPAWCTNIAAGFLQTGGLLQVNVPPVTQADARGATQGLMTDIVEPKILSWSLSVQHEIATNTSVELRYIGNHAVSLPAQFRPSQASAFDPRFPGGGITPLPTYFSASAVPGVVTAPASTLATFNGFQNNPLAADQFGSIFTEIPGLAMSLYHGGSVNVIHRLGHGLYVQGDYTLAHVDDDATAELFSTRVNPRRAEDGYNLKSQWGRSALDIRNKFAMSVAYELPSVHMSNAIARGFLNGWEWITTYLAETGQPVTALSGVDSNGNGDSSGDRTILNPNGTGRTGTVVDQVCNDGGGGTTRIVTASAAACADANVVGYVAENSAARYVQAGKGAKSNVGRNTISTPGLNIWNMSLLKSITFTERWKMQFRIATYNTFNHRNPSIGLPTNNGTIDQNDNPNPLSTTYPFVTAGNLFLNSSEFNAGSRRMELGLKVIF